MTAPPMVVSFLAVLMVATANAQSNVVTISEPGVYKLDELFKVVDVVAVVKVLSGDTENYDKAVYKGKVIQSFKGMATGQTVYFGQFIGERLGWEYVLFLRSLPQPLTPKTTAKASYGAVRYSEVFNEGYSSMPTSYECVFNGKEIAQQCDYAVRVCTKLYHRGTPGLLYELKKIMGACHRKVDCPSYASFTRVGRRGVQTQLISLLFRFSPCMQEPPMRLVTRLST